MAERGRRASLGSWLRAGAMIAVAALFLALTPQLVDPIRPVERSGAVPGTASPRPAASPPSAPRMIEEAQPPSPGPEPDPAAVAALIAGKQPVPSKTVSWQVVDVETADVISANRPGDAVIPASTMKLLTGLAALREVGPDARLTTSTKLSSDGVLALVGGGDPTLKSTAAQKGLAEAATLEALAKETAEKLRGLGATPKALVYDTSVFAGPTWHPSWASRYHSDVAEITGLWADGASDGDGGRVADPALDAATKFASLLAAQGVAIPGVPAKGTASGQELAQVRSPRLASIVDDALLRSDNTAAEALARATAIASKLPASFDGGAQAVAAALRKMGVDTTGARIVDGSGLSRENLVSAAMLAAVVRHAAEDAASRDLLDGLPVAGTTGTLRNRFIAPDLAFAKGRVRAKTGTLNGVTSLAGLTRTKDGRLLAFAFVANDPLTGQAKDWIDKVTAAITSCGC